MSAKSTEQSLELDPEGAGLAAKEELRSDQDQPDAPVTVKAEAQEEEFPEVRIIYCWCFMYSH
jgi:hypothetical protein